MPDGCVRTNIAWITLCSVVILVWCATNHDEETQAATESTQVSPAGPVNLLQFNGVGPSESPRLDLRPIISLAGAAASLFAAFLSTISARRAVYNDYQKHLIELNKECIKEPFLAAVNDDTRLEIETRQGDEFSEWFVSGGSRKLTHFAYMQLNIFEIVYEYEMSWPNRPMMAFLRFIPWLTSEANSPWMAYFVHQVRRSSELRKLIRRQDLEEYYSRRFAKFSKDKLADYEASQLATPGDHTQSHAGRGLG